MLTHKPALLRGSSVAPCATPVPIKPRRCISAGVGTRAMHAMPEVLKTTQPARVLHPSDAAHLRQRVKVSAAADAAGGFSEEAKPADDGSCTFTQAVFNVVNVVMGVGLLSLPYAFKSSGWIGLGVLIFMGYVATYTGKALVTCSNAVIKAKGLAVKSVGYEDIAQAAFGNIGRMIVSSMIYLELGGCCAMMFMLMGDNMFNLLGSTLGKTQGEYMLLGALLMIPTVWLPDLKALSFLGIFGLGATLTVAVSVAITLLSGSYTAGAVTHTVMFDTLPLVFGILMVCYSGHGVFPSIYGAMKEPEKFPQVLNVAYSIIVLVCAFIGGAGYYMYGPNAADVIVFNLPAGVLATLCSCVILVNPIAKFAVTMEPVAAALTKTFTGGASLAGLQRIALRTGLAVCLLLAARAVPMLALVMALLGSFLTISISVTFPALCHLVLCKGEMSFAEQAWDWFIVALGLLGTTLGTMASLANIAAKFKTV